MKLTFLIVLGIVLTIIFINTGISPASAQGQSASVAQLSASANVDTHSSENVSVTGAVPVVTTGSESVSNSNLYGSPTVLPATAAPLAQSVTAAAALNDFITPLKNGQPGQVVGVYVPQVLALKVAQQPANNLAYVNTSPGYATQFALAARYGVTGLLAHNYLSGALFSNLAVGQEVDVVYGDGLIRRYRVLILRHFQALNPTSPTSNFVDLDQKSGAQISYTDLFYQIYTGDRVVFQTCITANGNTSWGRLFVIATPIL